MMSNDEDIPHSSFFSHCCTIFVRITTAILQDNIPGRMISGLNSEELDFVSSESNVRELFELSGSFLDMLNDRETSENVTDKILHELDFLNE